MHAMKIVLQFLLLGFMTTTILCSPLNVAGIDERNNNSNEVNMANTQIASRTVAKKPHYTVGHNGRPGCRTAQEINRSWRNNNDPTRFWFCEELNSEAVEVFCPAGGYMNEFSLCVPWNMWEWLPPQDPPTMSMA
ncbi:uncharacterized protein LOC119684558 [Teleopsis dalmanni]|uniref:uncharacterized protein LOC119684558 n=1 Tax=Teleopsis dalmanni TaxID=139649 RepID=UPI0018CDACB8|nr:uncharacterized protein LOC119684558 [Teleopsis dalmanni]